MTGGHGEGVGMETSYLERERDRFGLQKKREKNEAGKRKGLERTREDKKQWFFLLETRKKRSTPNRMKRTNMFERTRRETTEVQR